MNRYAFSQLCHLFETSGCLNLTRNTTTADQLVMFLSILAHHQKNSIVKSNHKKSGRTISKYFHRVLNGIIRLHSLLLVRPQPIDENCTNDRWKHFKVKLNLEYMNLIKTLLHFYSAMLEQYYNFRGVWVHWMEHISTSQSQKSIELVIAIGRVMFP